MASRTRNLGKKRVYERKRDEGTGDGRKPCLPGMHLGPPKTGCCYHREKGETGNEKPQIMNERTNERASSSTNERTNIVDRTLFREGEANCQLKEIKFLIYRRILDLNKFHKFDELKNIESSGICKTWNRTTPASHEAISMAMAFMRERAKE